MILLSKLLSWVRGLFSSAPKEAQSPDTPAEWEAREKSNREIHDKQQALFEAAVISVITGSLDRSKNAVSVVQAASTALLAIYTGLLGFVYSSTGRGLPLVAVVTPLFLGAAVLGSTYYTSFIPSHIAVGERPGSSPPFVNEGTPDTQTIGRINAFAAYVSEVVQRRAWALRASVAALTVGLVALPSPFIQPAVPVGDSSEWISVTLPTSVPDGVPAALQDEYFKASIADAVAQADAERESATHPVSSTGDLTGWALLAGALFVAAVASAGSRRRPASTS